jgi:hypothetical protein
MPARRGCVESVFLPSSTRIMPSRSSQPVQKSLFEPVVLDRAQTRRVTDEAVERNASRLEDEWRDTVWDMLDTLTRAHGQGWRFTIDAVWEALGKIPASRAASSRMGPIMREYAATGQIALTGHTRPSQRPKTHGKPQREWVVIQIPTNGHVADEVPF